MGAKITPFNIFIEKFKKRANGEYEYISGYTGMSRKILIKHTICDNEFEVVASAFINTKTTCKKCANKIITKKIAEIHESENKELIKKMTKNEYELLKYIGYNKGRSIFKHNKCGHIFESRYDYFKVRGHRCPKCARKHTKYTVQELKSKFPVKNVEVIDITYPGPKIKIKCLKCNTIKEIGTTTYKNYKFTCCKTIESLKEKEIQKAKEKQYFKQLEEQKKKQKECEKKKKAYAKQLINETKYYKYYTEFKKIHGNDIEIKERVHKVTEKFLVKCNICNHEWKANFKTLRDGKGCPLCKSSKGERVINKYLLNNNYSFKKEYSFKNSEIKSLRFDFAVSLNNKIYLIEFDGKQHFNSDAQFGDNNKEEKFNKLVTNDKRKDKYCKDNNIPLLRIPYWEFNNIEKLLSEFLILEE